MSESLLVYDPLPDIIAMPPFELQGIPWIVCAANVIFNDGYPKGYLIVPAPRHFSPTMNRLFDAIRNSDEFYHGAAKTITTQYRQGAEGFIDQYGNFYNRVTALAIVLRNKQPFNLKRNGSSTELYSEGLY
jgi:hypothetical protein